MMRPWICRRCRQVGRPVLILFKRRTVGSADVAAVPHCPQCGNRDLVVVDSPEARGLMMPVAD
jgi:hypothetical protein